MPRHYPNSNDIQSLRVFAEQVWEAIEGRSAEAGRSVPKLKQGISSTGQGVSADSSTSGGGSIGVTWLPSRETLEVVTDVIGYGEVASLDVPIAKAADIVSIATSVPAYVVMYSTAAHRTDDAFRSSGRDPQPGTGIMAEVLTTLLKPTIEMSPVPVFVNEDSPVTTTCYLKVQNLSGVTSDVTVTITFIKREE